MTMDSTAKTTDFPSPVPICTKCPVSLSCWFFEVRNSRFQKLVVGSSNPSMHMIDNTYELGKNCAQNCNVIILESGAV
jgi:hypothetical protein